MQRTASRPNSRRRLTFFSPSTVFALILATVLLALPMRLVADSDGVFPDQVEQARHRMESSAILHARELGRSDLGLRTLLDQYDGATNHRSATTVFAAISLYVEMTLKKKLTSPTAGEKEHLERFLQLASEYERLEEEANSERTPHEHQNARSGDDVTRDNE